MRRTAESVDAGVIAQGVIRPSRWGRKDVKVGDLFRELPGSCFKAQFLAGAGLSMEPWRYRR